MSRDATLIVREPTLDFMLNNPAGDVGRYMAKKARLHVQMSRRLVGVRTGATKRSINARHMRSARGQHIEIVATSRAAWYHHEGTRPHVIVSHGRAMRFVVDGRVVFARVVKHPGTRPNRFLTAPLSIWRA